MAGEILVTLVGDFTEHDRVLIRKICGDLGWSASGSATPQIVIAQAEESCAWKTVLRNLQQLPGPPQLIVTSRMADDSLWAEVLNLGGYDVLALPFDRNEVERVLVSAARHLPRTRAASSGSSRL